MLCDSCYQLVEFFWQKDRCHDYAKNFKEVFFDEVYVMAKFQAPLSSLIKALKYQHHQRAAQFLGQMLFWHLNIIWQNYDLITFVPLHLQKLRQRGYNQSQLIAEEIGHWTQLPVHNLVKRLKNTPAQAKISNKNERLNRLNGLFALKNKLSADLTGQNIVLIDDVITTGATVNAVCRTLKQAGVKLITVICLAHH